MKRRFLLALALATAAAPAPATAPAGALEACITARLPAPPSPPAAGPGASADASQMLDRMRGVCYDIVSDQQQLDLQDASHAIYRNQVFENNVLLFMVVFITLSGVALAALQLWASYRLAVAGHGTLADGGDVNLGTSSVAVKSSVVGVVILGISLGFFALFLIYVYQIKPVAGVSGAGSGPIAGPILTAPAGMLPGAPALPAPVAATPSPPIGATATPLPGEPSTRPNAAPAPPAAPH